MGRICPILNHPLNDGVLIKDEALISFIQKRNVDFLAQEYVCRSCKREVEKLYKKKLKRAIELHRSRYHDGSVSTLKTSKDSSSSASSTTSEHSVALNGFKKRRTNVADIMQNGNNSSLSETALTPQNVEHVSKSITSADVIAVSETAVQILTSYNNESFILQENQKNLVNVEKNSLNDLGVKSTDNVYKNVTVRKRTIRDFYTPKPQNVQEKSQVNKKGDVNNADDDNVIRRLSQEPTTSKAAAAANNLNSTKGKITRHVTSDMDEVYNESDDESDVIRRVSQEPTTSKAAATNKRKLYTVTNYESEDDISINAINGTRLPHVQPLISKRRSLPDKPTTIARDIMDAYIRDITGG